MKNYVVLRKTGGFYSAFDDDAIIINYLCDYKITGSKCGFPLISLDKVINKLEDNSINYIIKDNMEKVNKKDFKRNNKYNKILDKGKKKIDIDYRINTIKDKINDMEYKDINNLLDIIDNYINE